LYAKHTDRQPLNGLFPGKSGKGGTRKVFLTKMFFFNKANDDSWTVASAGPYAYPLHLLQTALINF